MDTAFANHPLRCPHCLRSLLAHPTALQRSALLASDADKIMQWQRLLAKYAYWYTLGPRARTDTTNPEDGGTIEFRRARHKSKAADSLAFIGHLQGVMRVPPLMPSMALRRASMQPSPKMRDHPAPCSAWQPSFSNALWPSFHTQEFRDLCARYAQFHAGRQRDDGDRGHWVTHWWRRTWEGAVSRPIPPGITFEDPPFGVAEWLAFSPDHESGEGADMPKLLSRFDEDLQLTWDSWSGVLDQVNDPTRAGLHPRLVPPRSCWLDEPPVFPDAPVLGYF